MNRHPCSSNSRSLSRTIIDVIKRINIEHGRFFCLKSSSRFGNYPRGQTWPDRVGNRNFFAFLLRCRIPPFFVFLGNSGKFKSQCARASSFHRTTSALANKVFFRPNLRKQDCSPSNSKTYFNYEENIACGVFVLEAF